MPVGVVVNTSQVAQPTGAPTQPGTAFFLGLADTGPPAGTPYVACYSITDYTTAFGPRSATSATLYDALDVFFREGGRQAYVIRDNNASAVAATLTLNDAGAKPTVTVAALTSGVGGNQTYIRTTAAGGNFTVFVQD